MAAPGHVRPGLSTKTRVRGTVRGPQGPRGSAGEVGSARGWWWWEGRWWNTQQPECRAKAVMAAGCRAASSTPAPRASPPPDEAERGGRLGFLLTKGGELRAPGEGSEVPRGSFLSS